jgi:hypothetical protein
LPGGWMWERAAAGSTGGTTGTRGQIVHS